MITVRGVSSLLIECEKKHLPASILSTWRISQSLLLVCSNLCLMASTAASAVAQLGANDAPPKSEATKDHESEAAPETLPATPSQLSQLAVIPSERALATPVSAPQATAGAPVSTIEGMSWESLQAQRSRQGYCTRCKMPVETSTTTVVRTKKHQVMSCKQCHNTVTMLYRHWDVSQLGWKEMSEKDHVEFFLKAKELGNNGDKLCAGKIRALLVKTLTVHEKNVTETSVKGKYLPLSVYATKGFDVVSIKARAECQDSDLPLDL